ncbi:MAG: hypothetical protein ABF380_00250 [Akkermansiaceae bacterium]
MLKYTTFALFCVSMVSCKDVKDSPEMKKLEEERAAVKELEDELKDLKAEIGKTKVEELKVPVEDLQKKLDDQRSAIVALEEELKTLTKSEKEAKEKLEAYQRKYPFE